MHISVNGLNLLKSFESCRLEAYKDVKGLWTIGYGHTNDVHEGEIVSQAAADALLEMDLRRLETQVLAVLHKSPTQNQFDAMICLSYNIGFYAFKSSGLLQLFNFGDIEGAAKEFLKWDNVAHKECAGLLRRRQAEQKLFLS
jgi:lysozyme